MTVGNPFDAAIPGESLTNEPGNAAWEHPPQFTDFDDANDYLFERMTRPEFSEQIAELLKQGVPVEGVTRLIIFNGFREGKWNPDLGIMLIQTVAYFVLNIGRRHHLKKMKLTFEDDSNAEFMSKAKEIREMEAITTGIEEEVKGVPDQGFAQRREQE